MLHDVYDCDKVLLHISHIRLVGSIIIGMIEFVGERVEVHVTGIFGTLPVWNQQVGVQEPVSDFL